VLDVHLFLQGENSDYIAEVKIVYVLRQLDDWTIDVIDTKDMQIVKTGKYDNCISTRLWGMLGEHNYEFTNNCDVALLIGGVVYVENKGSWEKFSVEIQPNSQRTIGGFMANYKGCEIHFIERM
jgi:hypothetical protein